MSFLIGLPLRLLSLLAALIRIALPILLILLEIWLARRHSGTRQDGKNAQPSDAPHFKGPVYTVDYEEVKDDGKDKKPPES